MERVILNMRSFIKFQKNRKLNQNIKYAINKWTILAVLIWTLLSLLGLWIGLVVSLLSRMIQTIRVGTPRIIRMSLMLSILCGDPSKVSINQMPPATSFSPATPKHTKTTQRYHRNQFISLLRVRDSHRDYGRQPIRQSSRKVSSNHKALSFSFGFTFFSLVMDSSRVLFKATVLVLCFAFMSFI